MSDSNAPGWVVPVMRTGYSARALVYLVLGGLTIWAAWTGGQAEGTKGALDTLREQPFGALMLWIVALGFMCYALWRWIAAYYDLERRGDDEKGLFARLALVVTGTIHFAIGVGIAAILISSGDSGSGGGASDWTAKVLQMPGGRWIVAFAAACIFGAGVHYVLKGWQKKYEKYIRSTETTARLSPLLRWGFVSYGIVLGIVGVFLFFAALNSNPSEAKGIGGALEYIQSMQGGAILLGLIGLGILGFAVENAVEARYRVVPKVGSADSLKTLASRAKRKAQAAT